MPKNVVTAELVSQNQLLARLSPQEYERLLPHWELVTLSRKDTIQQFRAPISHVYFPLSCVISFLALMNGGGMIEAGLVGREGMVGIPVLLGTNRALGRGLCQVPGLALRMSSRKFRAQVVQVDAVRDRLLVYVHAFLAQLRQAAACNALHSVTQRCCRWMLMMRCRVDSNALPMTHQLLSEMLGVRRPGVTEAINELSAKGVIHNQRRQITLLDRAGLEREACECYRILQEEHSSLY